MATVKVKYNCGCRYSTTDVEEAVQHSNQQGHTLTAVGTIEKDEPKKRR